MAFLLVITGPNEGDYHPLENETVSIGRDEACTMQIHDELVSRKHLQIRFDAPAWLAVDERSANGVFVNDLRIESDVPLSDGDIIRIGESELIFSERDFIDRDTALEHYGRRPEQDNRTIIQ